MRRSTLELRPLRARRVLFDAVGSTPRLRALPRRTRRRPALDRRRGVRPPATPARSPARATPGWCRRAGRPPRRAGRARRRDRRGHGGAHRRACTSSTRASRSSSSRRATASADGCGRSTSTGSTGPSSSGPCSCPTTSRWSRRSVRHPSTPCRSTAWSRRARPRASRWPIPPTGDEAVDAARSWAEAAPADVSLAAALVGSGTVPMSTVPGADGAQPGGLARAHDRERRAARDGRDDEPRLGAHGTDHGVPARVATRDRATLRPARGPRRPRRHRGVERRDAASRTTTGG